MAAELIEIGGKTLKAVAVLPNGQIAESPLLPEVGEKSRGLAKERLLVFFHPAAGLIPRQQERKHLPDNACGGVVPLTPGFAVSFVFPLPDRSELIDNRWQVSPLPASLRPGVIANCTRIGTRR